MPLNNMDSNFSKKVFTIITKISKGNVATYASVAKKAGKPKAYRAVGNILRANPHPIQVPCHRIVKSTGEIGGYIFGKEKKREILKKEGVRFDKEYLVSKESMLLSL